MTSRPVILSLLLFVGCNNIGRQHKTIEVFSDASFLTDIKDTSKTTSNILEKYLPSVLEFIKADTSIFYFGDDIIEDDSLFRQLLIGKYLDKSKTIAVEVNLKDTTINFFLLDNNKWRLVGNAKTNIPVYKIDFEDLDGDDKNEIITSTAPNMNGNSWKEVYHYSDKDKKINYAGSFSTDYVIKKDKKQIEETYEGSWYMDNSKTLYQWNQDKLIPIKQIILAHDTPVTETGKLTFEYYENLSNDFDGLKLKFKERYSNNKKQNELWDNFFGKPE